MREPGVRGHQRVRRSFRSAVLPLVLVLGVSWAALLGLGRGESVAPGELPRLTIAALAPHVVTPEAPDTRLISKPFPAKLFLFAAALVSLLLGNHLRGRWSASAGTGSARTPSTLLQAVRGRAPPPPPA